MDHPKRPPIDYGNPTVFHKGVGSLPEWGKARVDVVRKGFEDMSTLGEAKIGYTHKGASLASLRLWAAGLGFLFGVIVASIFYAL